MSTSRNVAALGCLAAAALAAPAGFAQNAGWYVGGNIGGTAATIDDGRITSGLAGQGLATTGISDRDTDTGFRLFGGYQLNRNFAIEAGWFDLGKMGFTANTSPPGTLNGDARFDGVNLDLVGFLPLTQQLDLLGRIGIAYVHTRGTFSSSGAVLMPYSGTGTSANHTDVKFGGGLAWHLTPAWELRAEAERFRVDDSVGNRGHVDLFSVGIVYRFGARAPVARAQPAPAYVAAAPAPQPAPVYVAPTPPPAPMPAPSSVTVHFSADALFDFDQSTLKPEGIRQIDAFAGELRDVQYEQIRVVGYTDRLGSTAYNERLSRRRADAVAGYLVRAGLPANRIAASGLGEADPVTSRGQCQGNAATPALVACLQPDRRVDVQVDGMRRGAP